MLCSSEQMIQVTVDPLARSTWFIQDGFVGIGRLESDCGRPQAADLGLNFWCGRLLPLQAVYRCPQGLAVHLQKMSFVAIAVLSAMLLRKFRSFKH